MKIGFSSLVCPEWNLDTILAKAAEYGFDGVELHGLPGERSLPVASEVASDPEATRKRFVSANVELVCLGSDVRLDARSGRERSRQRHELEAYIRLASSLGCPYVRIAAGEVQRGQTRQMTLARVAEELRGIAPFAGEQKVAVLVENGGDFCGSADAWYLCDSASHPAIRVCWNPCTALGMRERPTTSIPRLASKIGLFHVCDGAFDRDGLMTGFRIPGTGDVELERAIELLRGVVYRDYLMFVWPTREGRALASPDEVLPQVQSFLRQRVDARQPVLTAYKGDKKAVKLSSPPPRSAARPA